MSLTPRRQTLFLLSQHQVGALVATAVDYAVMILCVSLLGAPPVLGTIVGSIAGAFVSFTLGRRWIFDAERGSLVSQAWRYALVSGLSLCGNALGEWLLVHAHLHYFVARVLTSLVVGVAWNFPMHRHFVFRADWDRGAAVAVEANAAVAPLHTPPAPPPSTN
jgi:putative flippase GtrA